MTLYKITEFNTEWFSVYPNITSKFRTIVIFNNKKFWKELICLLSLHYLTMLHE
jgi:hypothetical protein